jgi:hypothetical protein
VSVPIRGVLENLESESTESSSSELVPDPEVGEQGELGGITSGDDISIAPVIHDIVSSPIDELATCWSLLEFLKLVVIISSPFL